MGWSIDSSPTASLVTNALGMAIDNRQPAGETIIHSDQRVQCGSGHFIQLTKDAGLVPSMGSVGDCYDNATMESLWSRIQVEPLDSQRWRTRVESANAICEHLEIFHNRQRRHSGVGWRTPIEFETAIPVAQKSRNSTARTPGRTSLRSYRDGSASWVGLLSCTEVGSAGK